MEKRRHENFGFLTSQWPLHPGRPTLLLIHGAGFTDVLWRRQVVGLSAVANAVAVDLPGHGASAGPACASVAEYAARVSAFLEAVEAPRPMLCGHSFGGAIVQRLLIDQPDRFAAGVLINTGARLKVLPEIIDAVTRDYDAFVESLGSFMLSPQSDRERLQPLIHEGCGHEDPQVVRGDFEACNAFDAMDELAAIRAPVLVIGGEDDAITPPKYSEYLAEHIAGARLRMIEHAGHMVPIEQPEAVTDAIIGFLERVNGQQHTRTGD